MKQYPFSSRTISVDVRFQVSEKNGENLNFNECHLHQIMSTILVVSPIVEIPFQYTT